MLGEEARHLATCLGCGQALQGVDQQCKLPTARIILETALCKCPFSCLDTEDKPLSHWGLAEGTTVHVLPPCDREKEAGMFP